MIAAFLAATLKRGIGQTRYVLGAIGAKNRRAYPYFAREPIAPITHHNLCVECNRLDRRDKKTDFKKKLIIS